MDIVERLRMFFPNQETREEAADEIERLRDEVHFDDQTIKSLSEINDRLQKKNELLREALRVIRDELGDTPRDSMKAYEISDAALKEG